MSIIHQNLCAFALLAGCCLTSKSFQTLVLNQRDRATLKAKLLEVVGIVLVSQSVALTKNVEELTRIGFGFAAAFMTVAVLSDRFGNPVAGRSFLIAGVTACAVPTFAALNKQR